MKSLVIEGVRCFRERQVIPIRPVTLLVGENSSGKSTVLAMVRAAWDLAAGREPDFNERPFELGGYDAIAHRNGGAASSFRIAASFEERVKQSRRARTVEGMFRERDGQPVLADWAGKLDGASYRVERSSDGRVARAVGSRDGGVEHSGEVPLTDRGESILGALSWLRPVSETHPDAGVDQDRASTSLPLWWAPTGARPRAFAPVRSAPERTYDPKRAISDPEGSHVPMELAVLHATERAEFDRLTSAVDEFGRAAGLFERLEVKRLGRKAGDPFQLLVAVDRHAFNLRDVGYGVSQVLPILVDTLSAAAGQTFLLQQPEVHLHPRAQAALGSLLVAQAARRKQTFVVETHSDHLVDRVRMDVRERRGTKPLSHEDVVILYFEREGGRAKITPITLDERGNLVGVPYGYRQFFLDEERRLLGIG